MEEHTKLSEEEVVKLKNTLLQLNGALLRLGINKEDTNIVLPKADWVYFNNVLSSGQSSMSKYYQSVSDNTFKLSGISVTHGTIKENQMLCWYGRLVTSYKDGDLIQAVQSKDGKIIIGRIKLPDGHFSNSWYVETREARLHENDLLVVSPFDYWFRDNQDKLYDAILNMYMRKRMDG